MNLRSVVTSGAALALAASIFAGTAAEAAPVSITPRGDVVSTPSVDQVAYRRRASAPRYAYRGYRGRRYYNPGGAAVAGAALGLIGAGIAAATAPSYYPAYGYGYGYPAYGYGYHPYYGYGW